MFPAEVAESTWYLFKATGDPVLLEFGRILVDSIDAIARVPCGFATVRELHTAAWCMGYFSICVYMRACMHVCTWVPVCVCDGSSSVYR